MANVYFHRLLLLKTLHFCFMTLQGISLKKKIYMS